MRPWFVRAVLGFLVLFLMVCIGFLADRLRGRPALRLGRLPVPGPARGPHQLVGPGDGHRLPGPARDRHSPLPRLVLQATG